MDIHHELQGDTLIVRILEKKLDTHCATELKDALFELFLDENIHNLVFSVAGVESIDSSGLGAFLFGRRQAIGRGGECCLVSPGHRIVNLMKIARLDRVFESFDSEESAVNRLSS